MVITRTPTLPPFDLKEALRYAGAKPNDELCHFAEQCYGEAAAVITPTVCGGFYPLSIDGELVKIAVFTWKSTALAKNLTGCDVVFVFAATLGLGIDRLISAASRISPSRAVILQGIAAERVEALCDAAESEFLGEYVTRPRFSPGYGDLPLDVQRDVFSLLSPEKRIGLTLNASLMLSPTKSVTAIVGGRKNAKRMGFSR